MDSPIVPNAMPLGIADQEIRIIVPLSKEILRWAKTQLKTEDVTNEHEALDAILHLLQTGQPLTLTYYEAQLLLRVLGVVLYVSATLPTVEPTPSVSMAMGNHTPSS